MVLDQITNHKRKEVAQRKQERPLESFRSRLIPSDRSFRDALLADETGFILEAKKASPSKGLIRPNFQPVEIASAYTPFASAISVLTDSEFFRGNFGVLEAIRRSTTQPVLCKDFVLEPYQVYEARLHGADAVLLMLSVLDDDSFRNCYQVARQLNMDALVEVHTEEELKRAKSLHVEIVGINNRNLKSLEVDLNVTRTLAPMAREFATAVVCESGIRSHRDVVELRDQVDAFLIGTSLMSRPDLSVAIREIIFGSVKVCGLTKEEDVRAVFDAGATHGGLIFAKQSPRYVRPELAQQLVQLAPLRWVGVFVNEEPEAITEIVRQLNLSAVQLHGDETESDRAILRQLLPDTCEIWAVQRINTERPVLGVAEADAVLLDTYNPAKRGGTGQTFDWSILADEDLSKVILSGGLQPANAGSADRVGAHRLDVSSGIENQPGVKNHVKLNTFFQTLRGTRNRS